MVAGEAGGGGGSSAGRRKGARACSAATAWLARAPGSAPRACGFRAGATTPTAEAGAVTGAAGAADSEGGGELSMVEAGRRWGGACCACCSSSATDAEGAARTAWTTSAHSPGAAAAQCGGGGSVGALGDGPASTAGGVGAQRGRLRAQGGLCGAARAAPQPTACLDWVCMRSMLLLSSLLSRHPPFWCFGAWCTHNKNNIHQ